MNDMRRLVKIGGLVLLVIATIGAAGWIDGIDRWPALAVAGLALWCGSEA